MKNRVAAVMCLLLAVVSFAAPLYAQQDVPAELDLIPADRMASLAWSAEPGAFYEILTTTNLAEGVWTNALIDPIPSTNLIAQMQLMATDSRAFFRVRKLDTQGPEIISRYPAPDGVGVGRSTPLTIALSDASGIDTNSYRLIVNGGTPLTPKSAGVSYTTNSFTFAPPDVWGDYGATGTVVFSSTDLKGNPSVAEWSFVLEVLPEVSGTLIHLASAQPQGKADAVSSLTIPLAAPAEFAEGLTIVEIGTDYILFDYGTGGHGLYAGAILISHDLSNFFYRRITSLDDDPGSFRVKAWTEEAALTDIVQEGSFSSENISQGAAFGTIQDWNPSVTIPFSFEHEASYGSIRWVAFEIQAPAVTIDLSGSVTLYGQIGDWQVKKVGAVFESNQHTELRSGVKFYDTLAERSYSYALSPPAVLAVVPLGAIGPVPIVATIELQLFLKADASAEVSAEFQTGLDIDQTNRYSISWTPSGGVTKSATNTCTLVKVPLDVAIGGSAEANVYVSPQLSALVYGLGGPAVDVRVGPGIRATYNIGDPQTEIKLYGRLSLNGSLEVKGVPDHLLPEVTFFSYEQYLKTWYWPEIAYSAPVILRQLSDVTAAQGQSVTFTASVSGNPAPTYKWYFNGTQIPNQTGSSLTVTAGGSTAGNYKFKASNSQGSVSSAEAALALSGSGGGSSDMAYIPAGSFSMGDSFSEGGSDERPVHSVYVSAFYMSKTEITKAQWDEVYNWAITRGYSFDNAGSGKASSHPVHSVNWYDVVKWCNARSEKEGKTPCYTVGGNVYRSGKSAPSCNWSAGGYRLPTEAEWEKAARGGLSGKRFPWGDTIQHTRANYNSSSSYSYDTSSTRGYHPSYDNDPRPYTSPAGSFAANGYGLYDMAGNVWEWCWDWYDSGYYSSSPSSNPRGASSGSYRVGRGGYWRYYAGYCRSAGRGTYSPDGAGISLGFRVVLPPGQ